MKVNLQKEIKEEKNNKNNLEGEKNNKKNKFLGGVFFYPPPPPRHSFHTLHTYFPTILIGILFLIPLFINHLSYNI